MEVLVALTIFLLSLSVLGQLISFSSNRATEIEERSLASQMCQNKMAEVLAGAILLENVEDQELEEDNRYRWSLFVEDGGVEGLYSVTVRVYRPYPDGSEVGNSLTRLLLDPVLMGSTQDVPMVETVAEEEPETSGG
jgi:hypothetical protein